MTFIHTFYSEPLFKGKFEKFEISLNNILWNYTYSLTCIHKHNHKIKLFTDSMGKELLSFLPYDDIIVIDNFTVTHHFAASFKFYALKQCELEDILIDGDLFLEKKNVFDVIRLSKHDVLNSFIENNDYIFNSIRPNNGYNTQEEYFESLFEKMKTIDGLRYDLPKICEIEYPNTSLLKISNKKLKEEYIEQYFYHMNLLKNVNFGNTWPDFIIEQYFLGKIIENGNYSAKQILINFPQSSEWENKLGFVHLGNEKTKYLPEVKQRLYNKDKNMYLTTNMKIFEILTKRQNNLI